VWSKIDAVSVLAKFLKFEANCWLTSKNALLVARHACMVPNSPDKCGMVVSTNCGSPVPDISESRTKELFAELERDYGIRHGDAEARNITYSPQLGRFCVIDFEIAEILPLPEKKA
jgi:hypothetical protein